MSLIFALRRRRRGEERASGNATYFISQQDRGCPPVHYARSISVSLSIKLEGRAEPHLWSFIRWKARPASQPDKQQPISVLPSLSAGLKTFKNGQPKARGKGKEDGEGRGRTNEPSRGTSFPSSPRQQIMGRGEERKGVKRRSNFSPSLVTRPLLVCRGRRGGVEEEEEK